jgi:hypothetical protein
MLKHFGFITLLAAVGDNIFGTIGGDGDRYLSELESNLKA